MVFGFHTPHTVARLVLDTCNVIDRWSSPAKFCELESLYQGHRVCLAKTDVVDTELDPERSRLIDGHFLASIDLLELHGVFAPNHSRLGHSTIGSDEDVERLERVKEIIGIRASSVRNARHDFRDAMHISTSLRYHFDGFVTEDQRLLKLDSQFRLEFGFRIVDVVGAVQLVNGRIERQTWREMLNREQTWLDDECAQR